MKANGLIYFILGVLVIVTIYSLYQLNKISKSRNTNTNSNSTRRILEADIKDITPEPTQQQSEPILRQNVTGQELVEALRKKLNEQQVKSLNVTFTE